MKKLDANLSKYPIITYYYAVSLTSYASRMRSYWIKQKPVNVYRVMNVTGKAPQWRSYDYDKSSQQKNEKMASLE